MTHVISMTLGEYITSELGQRGWDIAKLARELGVSWQRAQRLSLDEPKRADGSPPTVRPETIEKVAKAFRVDPKKIMDQVYHVEDKRGQGSSELTRDPDPDAVPSIQALYEGLPEDEQDELMQIALMKWRKNRRGETTHGKSEE